nr:hypothetical protein [Tanacetum cinerariifolium]
YMRMIKIDAFDCGPEDVPATPLLNALRGTTVLSFEKRELKIRLQGMEQHAQLRDFAEFAEHDVMAARAADEFSKAKNDAP